MSVNQVQNAFDLLGQGCLDVAPRHLPGELEPQLRVPWGEFRQSAASSLLALLRRAKVSGDTAAADFFKDCRVERRIPRMALLAAAVGHIAFVMMPIPNIFTPPRDTAFENTRIAWSGSINDFPLLEIPRAAVKAPSRSELKKVAPPVPDAIHSRQDIFTDPVRPTHPRQTLINPKAPFIPPKILPNLPNMVQLAQAPAPERPKMQISEDTLKKIRPRDMRQVATAVSTPAPSISNAPQRPAEMNLALAASAPERPKLELNTGAAPRVAVRKRNGEIVAAPEISATRLTAANGGPNALIALSATPAPPAPVAQPPKGNLAARVALSPERKAAGAPNSAHADANSAAGKSAVGISISGANPVAKADASPANEAGSLKLGASSPRYSSAHSFARPEEEDIPVRTGPPNFATLAPGAKPEQIFASRRVYTLNVSMPNLSSATGSWILNFSELRTDPNRPRVTSNDLNGPAPLKKVDPKYPPALRSERVEGEVVLYAVIRRDGSVDSIQLVHGIDEQLDQNAMDALAQWKFRPAMRPSGPVELEAIVHIPFRIPTEE